MHRFRACWLVAIVLAASCCSAATSGTAPQAWSRLRFEHDGLALDARLEIDRQELAAEALPAVDPAVVDLLRPVGPAVGRLRVSSLFRIPPLLQRQREAVLWFDTASHAALRGSRETSGIGAGYRISAYGATGVHVGRAPEAAPVPPQGWASMERSFVAYGAAAQRCAVITEPVALLLLSPASLRAEAAGRGLCVLSHKRLFHPELSEPEEEGFQLDYRVHGAGIGPREVRAGRAIRYTLRLRSADGRDPSAGSEAFLGLDGEIEIHADPVTGMPLRLRGSASLLGRVDFRLREVWLPPAGST